MKFIDLPHIQQMVSYQKFYERGLELFQKNRVHMPTLSEWIYDKFRGRLLRITAVVEGSSHSYTVRATYQDGRGITDVTCNCAAFANYPTICKHCVAALLMLSELDVPAGGDYNTHRLISVMERSIRPALPESQEVEPDLSAACKLSYDGFQDSFELTLRAGKEKLYIVKDLDEFFEAMDDGLPIPAGKKQSYVPEWGRFDPRSQKLLTFVKNCYYDNKAYASKYYTRCAAMRVELLGSRFNRFFELASAEGLPVSGKISGQPLEVLATGNPPIQFFLSSDAEMAVFGLSKQIVTIRVAEEYYIYLEGTLYHPSGAFGSLVHEICDVLNESPTGTLHISDDQAAKFNALVVTPLAKQGLVEVTPALRETFKQVPLHAKVYLDTQDGSILANVAYCYGDKTYHVTDSQENPYRDVQQEYAIENLFAIANFQMRRDHYVLQDTGDDIYDFIRTSLPVLGELAQVYLSETFKRIKIRPPHAISAGVRINGDLLELQFDFGEYTPQELLDMLKEYRVRKRYFKLSNGSFVDLEGGELAAVDRLVDGLDISDEDFLNGTVELPKNRALYLDLLSRENSMLRLEREPAVKRMIRDIRDASDSDFAVPQPLKKILRPYQKTGYRWLKTLSHYDMCGILADDMGLGKTLQVITLMKSEKENGKPALIVVPTSLLYNWKSEFNRFAPDLRLLVAAGNAADRAHLLVRDAVNCDVVITSYELLKRDIDRYTDLEFSFCIIDEAQYIKNHTTQNAKAVKLIRADHRFALTGTPIENSLSELWSIFDFLMPGYLGSYGDFKEKYEIPVVKNQDENRSRELYQRISPFLIRRLKKDVLHELPEKIETQIMSEMTQAQHETYLAYLAQARREIASEIAQKGAEKSRIKILSVLTRLRQICCHPSLFLENYDGGSGKFDLAIELIEDSVQGGHRILLFSQFTHMLGLLAQRLRETGISFFYLDGATKAHDRLDMVDRFNDGECEVFLISLKAGGNGLNLTGADIVIHYDPWWNPAVENQATDRAYRIGQEKRVQVFRLLTQGTIEEKIQQLKEKKQGLIDSIVHNGETFINRMEIDEIMSLFEEA